MPFLLLAVLVLLIYLLYGKKLVYLVGKKFLSIIIVIVATVLLVKSGALGMMARFFAFMILKVQEWIGGL
ncbi:MAG TPA: hypothetical protein H9667_07610 [Firmicutes bacterium]|nr:hypothetical protein [Bacillales bacterium]HJA41364.1 hypothetical protein [Bacillota bacterium]